MREGDARSTRKEGLGPGQLIQLLAAESIFGMNERHTIVVYPFFYSRLRGLCTGSTFHEHKIVPVFYLFFLSPSEWIDR